MPETFKSLKIGTDDHRRLKELSARERLRDYQAVGAALDAFFALPKTKRDQIVTDRAKREPAAAA